MFSSLKPGDIILELDDEEPLDPEQKDYLDALLRCVAHVLIYYEDQGVGKVIHSQVGTTKLGVISHQFAKRLRQSSLDSVFNLGDVVAVRLKDTEQAKLLAQVAARWDPDMKPELVAMRPTRHDGEASWHLLPTAFSYSHERTNSESSALARNELYRAFRAYVRNHTSNYIDPYTQQKLLAEPLSKTKGISCNSFFAYSCKIAYMLRHIPKRCLIEISQHVAEIENTKVFFARYYQVSSKGLKIFDRMNENFAKNQPATDLEKIAFDHTNYFVNFFQHVTDILSQVGGMDVQQILNYLSLPIKGLDAISNNFLNFDTLDLVGFPVIADFEDNTDKEKNPLRLIDFHQFKFLHAQRQSAPSSQQSLMVKLSELKTIASKSDPVEDEHLAKRSKI